MKKILICIMFFFLLLLLFSYKSVGNSAYSNILTLVSILIGFALTSLTLFASSPLSGKLQKRNKKTNLLEELVNEYKLGVNIFLFTIVFILIHNFLYPENVDNYCWFVTKTCFNLTFKFGVKSIIETLIWSLTMFSLFHCRKLFQYLFDFTIKSGNNSSSGDEKEKILKQILCFLKNFRFK